MFNQNPKQKVIIMKETRKRSIAKTITFRILATITTMIIVLLLTGNLAIAGIVGFWEIITKLLLYYAHERVWEIVKWGRKS